MFEVPIRLSKASGVPFYRQLHEQLADRIRSGALPPGYALPSIRELAAELLVSVITVKSAYEQLERDALIVSHQGRGTFVAEGAAGASQKQLEGEIAAGLKAAVVRAATVGISKTKLRRVIEEAIRKAYEGEES
jgi:GntR family transcriptional regulator